MKIANKLSILFVLTSIATHAQYVSKHSLIDLDVDFQKSAQSYPSTALAVTQESSIISAEKSVAVAPRYGYSVDSANCFGVGFEIGWVKQAVGSETVIENKDFKQLNRNTEIRTIWSYMPELWYAHRWYITNKFIFSADLSVRYGKIDYTNSVEQIVMYAYVYDGTSTRYLSSSHDTVSSRKENNTSASQDCFDSKLSPCLTYFFCKHFALKLNLGGAYYQFVGSTDNSLYGMSVQPSKWRFGLSAAL